MIQKQAYLDKIQTVEDTLKPFGLEDAVAASAAAQRSAINEHRFRILVIGGFSAGKSSFLNKLLGRPLLSEAQKPETTIATELLYDTEEYIEAVAENGQTKRFPLDAGTALMPQDWRYLVYHLNDPYLQKNAERILVDMPGLDSPIEWHNKAIAQYIERGSAYILLTSCEDGTLRATTTDFLREISQYPQDVYCFVSKSDLKMTSDVDAVVEDVRAAIAELCSPQTPVVPLSTVSDDDAAFRSKAEAAFAYFNEQQLFDDKFRAGINGLIDMGVNTLQTSADALVLDTADLDAKIHDCQVRRDTLQKKLEDEKRLSARKFNENTVSAILDDASAALEAQEERLLDALSGGSEVFTRAVNSILRPVLYNSTEQHIQSNFDDIAGQFGKLLVPAGGLGDLLQSGGESLEQGLNLLKENVQGVHDRAAQKQTANTGDGGFMSKAMTGVLGTLAIATDVINPILELVIVALPTILNLISGFTQRSQQQAQQEEARRRLRGTVIPEITDKLRPQVSEAVSQAREMMLEELTRQTNELINAQEAALKDAGERKEQKQSDLNAERERRLQAIETLKALRV